MKADKFSEKVAQMIENKKLERQLIATVDIVPHGNLILEVDSPTGLARFRVLSTVLCLASPVFRAMLGPGSNFKEACELRDSEATSKPYTISLGDTDPQALAVILNVFHLRNDHVPKTVSFANLCKLAIICDKYDCATATALWIPLWTADWVSGALQPGNGKWLFIAWALKIDHVFTAVSKKVILEGYYADANSPLLTTGGFPAIDPDIPEIVIEEIIRRRELTIKSMLDSALGFLQRYYKPSERPQCRHLVRSEQCDMVILGSIIKAFHSMKIIPSSFGATCIHEEVWLESIGALEASLRSFQLCFLQITGDKPCKPSHYDRETCKIHGTVMKCGDHTKCSFLPEFFIELDKIMAGVKGLSLYDFKSRQMPPKGPQGRLWSLLS